MTDGLASNRLDEEESPYLRAHADNPVHWQPWDEAALEAAQEQDRPIFLSVGYAACHWCHVMADESFEDEAVAAVLNDNFVPIKVDREERPDVDSVYQTVCQRVTGRGGWPLSVWLTPEGEPFQVGTYFPREASRGMPGFLDMLENIAASWEDPDERAKMESQAGEWTDLARGELEDVPDESQEPEDDLLESAALAAVRGADRQHGGWGSGPKFPHSGRLNLLSRAHLRTDRDVFREVLTETLDAMADGGMYDHVGGGFHRYATDRDWTIPHFEKMLYDNAELTRAYLAGYQLTEDERYADVVRETLAFVERELTHSDGGFFSTLDAQSEQRGEGGGDGNGEGGGEGRGDGKGEREEGAFYVWTPEEVQAAVGNETTADLFCQRYGVTESGNFEGRTVLTRTHSLEDVAAGHVDATELVAEQIEAGREAVFEARANRPRPPRDEKILASWNGLMISAFAEAALVLDDDYAETAVEALAFVREHLWDGERLQRRYADGVVKVDGYLEDYAFLARGALNTFEATRDPEHLAFAIDLAEAIEREFWDADAGTLYFTPNDGESLIARPQELTDQSTPSSAGVAATTLDILQHFRTDDTFGDIATQVVETQGSHIESNPLQHASLTLAADTITKGVLELALVADEPPAEWHAELASRYVDPQILAWRPANEKELDDWLDILGLDETPPIWAERTPKDDEPTVYACRARTCSPGRNELFRALNWAEKLM